MPQKWDFQLQMDTSYQNRHFLCATFHKLLPRCSDNSKASSQKCQWFFSMPHEVFTFNNIFLSLQEHSMLFFIILFAFVIVAIFIKFFITKNETRVYDQNMKWLLLNALWDDEKETSTEDNHMDVILRWCILIFHLWKLAREPYPYPYIYINTF